MFYFTGRLALKKPVPIAPKPAIVQAAEVQNASRKMVIYFLLVSGVDRLSGKWGKFYSKLGHKRAAEICKNCVKFAIRAEQMKKGYVIPGILYKTV